MYDYNEAFSRNIGWVTEAEQQVLRGKKVAIAGMGGVGGIHLLTLCRLGVSRFHIADFDEFELGNFNRQAGAGVRHLGRRKDEVMAELARDINPEAELTLFPDGVNADNLDAFLDGVDLYLDALDFFVLDMRADLFAACAAKAVPALTAAPLGMGSALLCFMPGKMTFEEYFRFENQDQDEKALRFMLGLSPSLLQMPYLADESRVDFNARRGPSTPMACELCAGFAGTYALKILLNRGEVVCAPRGIHFDAYRNKLKTTWRPWGNRNPIQRLGLRIARSRVMAKAGGAPRWRVLPAETLSPLERILDLARWAPSGDNEIPYRFEVQGDMQFVVHTHDTREWCVYDPDGSSSQIAVGALLENISLAAGQEGLRASFRRDPDTADDALRIEVSLTDDNPVTPDPLARFIDARVTQRKAFSTRPLTAEQKAAMESAVGEGYRILWLEGRSQRWRVARLLFNNAHIRLTTPEAYETHSRNIEWGVRFSENHLPEYALGVDLLTRKVMRWVLKSWGRVRFANRFLAGTWLPRLQMDLWAGAQCGAHFAIVADKPLDSLDDYIAGGRAMQRAWLAATAEGLQFQPTMTPVIFSRYVEKQARFTRVDKEWQLAIELSQRLTGLLGGVQSPHRVFMGRVGIGPAPDSRSVRPPFTELLQTPPGN